MTYEEIMIAWKELYNSWFDDPMKSSETLIKELEKVANMCTQYVDERDEKYEEVFELGTRINSYIDILKRGDE